MGSSHQYKDDLLIPPPKRGLSGHLLTFISLAVLLHALGYVWLSKYGRNVFRKSPSLISVNLIKEVEPPKPKPKPLPPPPKPKPTPQKQKPEPMAAAPKLHLEQVKFHATKTSSPQENSNLLEVGETKGGSKYGNPEGVTGGKGNIESTGTAKVPQHLPPPPPPPPPKPAIPDRKFPVVLGRCEPNYPDYEQQAGVQGTVQILVLVGKQGQIVEVKVSQSSGNPNLDEAAIQSVRQCWKFGPAIQGGEPVEAQITFPVVFQLQ